MTSKLPKSASVATAGGGAKLHAPAAARNAEALLQLLSHHGPSRGQALEIASGTGQHVVAFARAMPDLIWQPTEVDADRLASIDAYAAEADLPNLRPAIALDAVQSGWSDAFADKDLILLVNLLHLITDEQAETVLREAIATLSERGRAVFYGPFKRDGQLTSDGDARFDADLRGANPEIGYKDDRQIVTWLRAAGADSIDIVDMPANNLAFVASKRAP